MAQHTAMAAIEKLVGECIPGVRALCEATQHLVTGSGEFAAAMGDLSALLAEHYDDTAFAREALGSVSLAEQGAADAKTSLAAANEAAQRQLSGLLAVEDAIAKQQQGSAAE